jgi:pantoate--beta-alanine ligase
MIVIQEPAAMRAWSLEQRAAGRTVGFVPTMGALHAGHESLMRAASAGNDAAVLSIYVNPAQFAPHEDFDAYPRTWDDDLARARATGMAAIYAPRNLYPDGYATYVTVEGLSDGLCSGTRPHFFRGVATVVAKLFNAVLPDRAYFGQKDAQQCAIIRRMARDLDMGLEVVEMPIVREPDGLAMSSRNRYLGPEDRQRALALSRALDRARVLLDAGERDAAPVIAAVRETMAGVEIDYVELVDADTMRPVARVAGTVLLAVAAQVGPARLIDNLKYTVPDTERNADGV